MGLLREWYRRCLVATHRPRHWHLRPGTIDRRIFRHVVIDNEYRLPSRFSSDDVVLDIGAHTGSFALAALRRGAGRVHCFEPDAENYRYLTANLQPYRARVELANSAVWRMQHPLPQLALHNPLDPRNTGACRLTTPEQGALVSTVAFDTLVEELTSPGRTIRLVKFDCEGAEWPILLTTQRLDRIEALCGEYHLDPQLPACFQVADFSPFTPDLLADHLGKQGFRVHLVPQSKEPFPVGLFFASRL